MIGLRGGGALGARPPPPPQHHGHPNLPPYYAGGRGGLRGRPGGGGGSVGTRPQNNTHDALMILNIHKWGKIFLKIFFTLGKRKQKKQNWLLDLGAHFLKPPTTTKTILGLPSPAPPPSASE